MLSSPARPVQGFHLPWAVRWPIAIELSRSVQFALITLAIPFIVLANRPLSGDIFWVLSYARGLLADGRLPTGDPFTFAPHVGMFTDAQWLAQLIYAVPYLLLGLQGVIVFHALTCTATIGIVMHLAWRRTGSPRLATLSVLVILLPLLGSVEARAQTLAYVPFVATLSLLQMGSTRARTLIWLAMLEAVWANLHGSFFLGPSLTLLTLGGYVLERAPLLQPRSLLADRRVRFLVLAGLAQAVATLATPYGLQTYGYILSLSQHPTMHVVEEWMPTRIDQPLGLEFFLTLGIAIALLGRSRSRRAPADVLMVGVFGVMAIAAGRNIGFWTLICPPIMAVYMADLRLRLPERVLRSHGSRRTLIRGWVLGASMSVLVLASLPWAKAVIPSTISLQRKIVDATYPASAVEFLLDHQAGSRLLAYQTWGTYLDWVLWPHYQLMVDCAIEVHPQEVWSDYLNIDGGSVTWEQLVDKYGVETMLLSKTKQQPLIEAVQQSPRWRATYSDEQTVVYERNPQPGPERL